MKQKLKVMWSYLMLAILGPIMAPLMRSKMEESLKIYGNLIIAQAGAIQMVTQQNESLKKQLKAIDGQCSNMMTDQLDIMSLSKSIQTIKSNGSKVSKARYEELLIACLKLQKEGK